jgi:hypothetical protein
MNASVRRRLGTTILLCALAPLAVFGVSFRIWLDTVIPFRFAHRWTTPLLASL